MHSSARRSRPTPGWRSVLAAVAVGIAVTGTLAGCTNAVPLDPAPSANAAACAAVQVRLPDTVDGKYAIRATTAQSTAAWGDPSAVILHCGVAVPTVSDLPCFTLGSMDWIRDDKTSTIVYTTFGRTPAVQVVVDTSKVTSDVLQDIGDAVGTLPRNGHRCLDPSDVATP